MARIRPFEGYTVRQDLAARVVAPAYDTLTPEVRLRIAGADPLSYLNITHSVDDYPPNVRPRPEELAAAAANRLQSMLADGVFERHAAQLFVYRIATADHVQTGIVAEVPVAEYRKGLVKRHESVRDHKVDELLRHTDAVSAVASPISLTYRALAGIDSAVGELAEADPMIRFETPNGEEHAAWAVSSPANVDLLTALFADVDSLYITDGHHRAATADRRAEEHPEVDHFLAAIFPDHQMRTLAFNRCVTDHGFATVADLLQAVGERFDVAEAGYPVPKPGELSMYAHGLWYLLTPREERASTEPLSALDVSILHNELLGPVLGISDLETDPRLSYVPGSVELEQVALQCPPRGVAFALHPTSVHEVMVISDLGQLMPPKSTWFYPKLRSGLFLRAW